MSLTGGFHHPIYQKIYLEAFHGLFLAQRVEIETYAGDYARLKSILHNLMVGAHFLNSVYQDLDIQASASMLEGLSAEQKELFKERLERMYITPNQVQEEFHQTSDQLYLALTPHIEVFLGQLEVIAQSIAHSIAQTRPEVIPPVGSLASLDGARSDGVALGGGSPLGGANVEMAQFVRTQFLAAVRCMDEIFEATRSYFDLRSLPILERAYRHYLLILDRMREVARDQPGILEELAVESTEVLQFFENFRGHFGADPAEREARTPSSFRELVDHYRRLQERLSLDRVEALAPGGSLTDGP
jgi:hypothetical protein